MIADLSFRLGRAENELKNSIPMIEHKKSTYLLETSKNKTELEKVQVKKQALTYKNSLDKLQTLNILLSVAVATLLCISIWVWYMSL